VIKTWEEMHRMSMNHSRIVHGPKISNIMTDPFMTP